MKKNLWMDLSAALLHGWPVYERPKEKQKLPVSIQRRAKALWYLMDH